MEISCTLGIERRKEAECMGEDNKGSRLTKEERKIIANLGQPPVADALSVVRFRSLSGTISHPASQFTIQLVEQ